MLSTREWRSGVQESSPLCGPCRTLVGNRSPSTLKVSYHGPGRAGPGEGGEQVPQCLRGTPASRSSTASPAGSLTKPTGRAIGSSPRRALESWPLAEWGVDEMELCLRQRPLEPEQHPVVEVGGIVKAVFVTDQGARESAYLQKPVPIGVVAGQSAAFEA